MLLKLFGRYGGEKARCNQGLWTAGTSYKYSFVYRLFPLKADDQTWIFKALEEERRGSDL